MTVTDTVRNSGDEVAELIWGHHPSLGGDLLRGGATISLEEADVFVDARLTEGSLLAPGTSDWPTAHTKDGRELDLRTFIKSGSLLCSLVGVSGARVEVARADGQLGATLRWDRSTFPYLWLWEEAGGLTDAPWNGAVEILGLEPASTLSPCGLAEMARGEHTTKLAPGAQVGAWVAISTWRPFM